jgi:hypothetical protein
MNYTSIKDYIYRLLQSVLLYMISYYAMHYVMRVWKYDHNIVVWQTIAFVTVMTMYCAVIVPYLKYRGFRFKGMK